MGGGIIKTIILGIILVVLSFVLGSQAVDGAKTPLLLLVTVCVLLAFNYLGPRCWWLLFILPPLVQQLPFGIVYRLPIHYTIGAVVLLYWAVMWLMGYVRFTWNGVLWLDIISLLPFVVMAVNYYNHPVSINALGLDVDTVGGEPFLWAAGAAIYYLSLSCIPVSLGDLTRAYKIGFFIQITFAIIFLPKLATGAGGFAAMGEQMAGGRYLGFYQISNMVLSLLVCAYPLMRILLSPWRLLAMLMSLAGIALGGYRGNFIKAGFLVFFMSAVRRQLLSFFLLGLSAYGLLLYASSERALDDLPFGIQRSLAILPGIEVGEDAGSTADASDSWRYDLWALALDPRSGYIKDYIWGDGFGISKRRMEQEVAHNWRGSYNRGHDHVEYFAEQGVWHLAVIIWVHRVGFVGSGVMFIWSMAMMVALFRIAPVLLRLKKGLFLLIAVSGYFSSMALEYITAGSLKLIFGYFSTASLVKITYSLLLRSGDMAPFFSRRLYVPLAIREHEAEVLQNRPRITFLPRRGER